MLYARWRYRGHEAYVCGLPITASDPAPACPGMNRHGERHAKKDGYGRRTHVLKVRDAIVGVMRKLSYGEFGMTFQRKMYPRISGGTRVDMFSGEFLVRLSLVTFPVPSLICFSKAKC